MTLLDRFRAVPPHKHPDTAVRLAHVAELPLDDRAVIESIAREDPDAGVRRAAVGKLLDPAALTRIAQSEADETVRSAAVSMLRDVALEAFEGVTELSALDAVDGLPDTAVRVEVARGAEREIVALRALSSVRAARDLGAIARQGKSDAARRGAFELLREQGETFELLAVAMGGEHKDTAVAAVETIADRTTLERIASESRNKAASRRARGLVRDMEEAQAAEQREAEEQAQRMRLEETLRALDAEQAERAARMAIVAEAGASAREEAMRSADLDEKAAQTTQAAETAQIARDAQLAAEAAALEAAAREVAASEARRARLVNLAAEIEHASADADLAAAGRRMAAARADWDRLVAAGADQTAVSDRVAAAHAHWVARAEADSQARRQALARLGTLAKRAEAMVDPPRPTDPTHHPHPTDQAHQTHQTHLSVKEADRVARDVRAALANMPPLPGRHDAQEIGRRLKAVQVKLAARLQELHDTEEWHRWANAGVQEQLCAEMEALAQEEDPERIAQAVRELQRRWKEAADVPRAQSDQLWRRFKAAHDVVWPRCEAHFAAQHEMLRANLARKLDLCARAEALSESTSWLATADAIKSLQAEWKTIGAAPRGQEKVLWERFRTPCTRFFTRRAEDLAQRKTVWIENLAKKTALCEQAEALVDSTEWDRAAADIKRLQAEWKTIGAVKKSRSDAIWERFRGACDRFFANYAQRDAVEREKRGASRESLCAEIEALASPESSSSASASDVLALARRAYAQWRQDAGSRRADTRGADEIEQRFAAALDNLRSAHPAAFKDTDLDPEANRARMEALVERVEQMAGIGGKSAASASPATDLAARLKEALASNTIGGKVDEQARARTLGEDLRQAQAAWTRIGPVPDTVRRPLQDRFQKASRAAAERFKRF